MRNYFDDIVGLRGLQTTLLDLSSTMERSFLGLRTTSVFDDLARITERSVLGLHATDGAFASSKLLSESALGTFTRDLGESARLFDRSTLGLKQDEVLPSSCLSDRAGLANESMRFLDAANRLALQPPTTLTSEFQKAVDSVRSTTLMGEFQKAVDSVHGTTLTSELLGTASFSSDLKRSVEVLREASLPSELRTTFNEALHDGLPSELQKSLAVSARSTLQYELAPLSARYLSGVDAALERYGVRTALAEYRHSLDVSRSRLGLENTYLSGMAALAPSLDQVYGKGSRLIGDTLYVGSDSFYRGGLATMLERTRPSYYDLGLQQQLGKLSFGLTANYKSGLADLVGTSRISNLVNDRNVVPFSIPTPAALRSGGSQPRAAARITAPTGPTNADSAQPERGGAENEPKSETRIETRIDVLVATDAGGEAKAETRIDVLVSTDTENEAKAETQVDLLVKLPDHLFIAAVEYCFDHKIDLERVITLGIAAITGAAPDPFPPKKPRHLKLVP